MADLNQVLWGLLPCQVSGSISVLGAEQHDKPKHTCPVIRVGRVIGSGPALRQQWKSASAASRHPASRVGYRAHGAPRLVYSVPFHQHSLYLC